METIDDDGHTFAYGGYNDGCQAVYGGDDAEMYGGNTGEEAETKDDTVVKLFKHKVSVSFRLDDPSNLKKAKQKWLMLFNRIRTLTTIDQRYVKFYSTDDKEIETRGLPDGEDLKKLFKLAPRVNRRFKTNVEGFVQMEMASKSLWTVKKGIMEFLKKETVSINLQQGTTLEPMVVLGFIHKGDSRMNAKWITSEMNSQIEAWLDPTKRTKFELKEDFVSDIVVYHDRISSVYSGHRIAIDKGLTVMCPQRHKALYLEFLQRDYFLDDTRFGPLAKSFKFVAFSWKSFEASKSGIAKAIRSTQLGETARHMVSVSGLDLVDTSLYIRRILHECKEIIFMEPSYLVERTGTWNFYCKDKDEHSVVTFLDTKLKQLLEYWMSHPLKNVGNNPFKRLETKAFNESMYKKVFNEVEDVELPNSTGPVNTNKYVVSKSNAWSQRPKLPGPSTQKLAAGFSTAKELLHASTQAMNPKLAEFEKEMALHREQSRKMAETLDLRLAEAQQANSKLCDEALAAAEDRKRLEARIDSVMTTLSNRMDIIVSNLTEVSAQGNKQGQMLLKLAEKIEKLESSMTSQLQMVMTSLQTQEFACSPFKRDTEARQKGGLTPTNRKKHKPGDRVDLLEQFDEAESVGAMSTQSSFDHSDNDEKEGCIETGQPRAAGQK